MKGFKEFLGEEDGEMCIRDSPSWHTSSEKDSPTPQTSDPTIQRNKKHKAPRAATRLPFFI